MTGYYAQQINRDSLLNNHGKTRGNGEIVRAGRRWSQPRCKKLVTARFTVASGISTANRCLMALIVRISWLMTIAISIHRVILKMVNRGSCESGR